jgi:hypothetical protein
MNYDIRAIEDNYKRQVVVHMIQAQIREPNHMKESHFCRENSSVLIWRTRDLKITSYA